MIVVQPVTLSLTVSGTGPSLTVSANTLLTIQPVVRAVTVAPAPTSLVVTAPGPQGTPGPTGPAGTPGGSQFLLNQVVPAATWLVQHNLGYFPHITLLDASGDVGFTDVHHTDINAAVLTFASPTTGKVIAS